MDRSIIMRHVAQGSYGELEKLGWLQALIPAAKAIGSTMATSAASTVASNAIQGMGRRKSSPQPVKQPAAPALNNAPNGQEYNY